jgi:hypothetical protein
MARKKVNGSKLKTGNFSHISGNVNIAGGDITTHQTTTGLSVVEIKNSIHCCRGRTEKRKGGRRIFIAPLPQYCAHGSGCVGCGCDNVGKSAGGIGSRSKKDRGEGEGRDKVVTSAKNQPALPWQCGVK